MQEKDFVDYANYIIKSDPANRIDFNEIKSALLDYKNGSVETLRYEVEKLEDEVSQLRRSNNELYMDINALGGYGYRW